MKRPPFTSIPHELIDTHLPNLSHGELKVLLVIFRHTHGWHRETFTLSMADLSRLTGMAKGTCCDAVTVLSEKGLITKIINKAEDGSQLATTYEIAFENDKYDKGVFAQPNGGVRPAESHIRNKDIKSKDTTTFFESSAEDERKTFPGMLSSWKKAGLLFPEGPTISACGALWKRIGLCPSDSDIDLEVKGFAASDYAKKNNNPMLAFVKHYGTWKKNLDSRQIQEHNQISQQLVACKWKTDQQFKSYIGLAVIKGKRITGEDRDKAGDIWDALTPEQKTRAISDYEYVCKNASEGKYITGPFKHLSSSPWDNFRVEVPEDDHRAEVMRELEKIKQRRLAAGQECSW